MDVLDFFGVYPTAAKMQKRGALDASRISSSATSAINVSNRLAKVKSKKGKQSAQHMAQKLKMAGTNLQRLASAIPAKSPAAQAKSNLRALPSAKIHSAIPAAVAARSRSTTAQHTAPTSQALRSAVPAPKKRTHLGAQPIPAGNLQQPGDGMQAAVDRIVANASAYAAAIDQLTQAGNLLATLSPALDSVTDPTLNTAGSNIASQLQSVADNFPSDPSNADDVAAAVSAVSGVPDLISQGNAWIQQAQQMAQQAAQTPPQPDTTAPGAPSASTASDTSPASDMSTPSSPVDDGSAYDTGPVDDGGYGAGSLDSFAVSDLTTDAQQGAEDAVEQLLSGGDDTTDDGGDSSDDGSGSDDSDVEDSDPGDNIGALDLMGVEIAEAMIGYYDLGTATKQMDSLKNVPVGVAQIFVKRGMDAINTAIANSKQPWYRSDLPGGTDRSEVQGHLQWHQSNLVKIASTSSLVVGGTGIVNPTEAAIYPDGADLKKWVLQAFVEENATEQGRETASQTASKAWDDYVDMWKEAGAFIASLPPKALEGLKNEAVAIRKAVTGAAGGLIEDITGLPVWAWALIGVGVVGVLGLVAWAVLNSKAGAVATGVIAKRYVG